MSKRRSSSPTADDPSGKRARQEPPSPTQLGDDMLFEVLGRADARSLARASCVSRHWHRLTLDERLWEIVCTRHWSRIGCSSPQQLRAAVLAIGGFRKLHSLYILPLVQNQCRRSSSSYSSSSTPSSSLSAILPSGMVASPSGAVDRVEQRAPLPKKWGKDEIMLSMSLLSTRHFHENWSDRWKGGGGSEGGGGAV